MDYQMLILKLGLIAFGGAIMCLAYCEDCFDSVLAKLGACLMVATLCMMLAVDTCEHYVNASKAEPTMVDLKHDNLPVGNVNNFGVIKEK